MFCWFQAANFHTECPLLFITNFGELISNLYFSVARQQQELWPGYYGPIALFAK